MQRLENIDFLQYVGHQESTFITSLDTARADILDRMEQGPTVYGDELPWRKTHNLFRFRPGEVTLWAGINGHGKSMILSHTMANLLDETKWLLASLEMPISATGQRLVRQIAGTKQPTANIANEIIDWTAKDRLYVYDQTDRVEIERILGLVVYAFIELQVEHIVIDSLIKCGISHDDYDRQTMFMDRLTWAAKTYNGHIHLVHHVRKSDSEEKRPDKFDVRGSSAIVDLTDNLLIVHRNKGKERRREQGKEVFDHEPDATLSVDKQRHGEFEGVFKLWFHPDSMQYLHQSDARGYRYGPVRQRLGA